MKQKRIEVTFEEDGTATVEAIGFDDAGCLRATESYERDLGGAVRRELKPEARRAQARQREVQQ